MYKAKLFAVTLAAVSLISLSAPAFADTQESSGETRIESTTDDIDNEMNSGEDTDDETVPSENADDAADSSESDNETDSEESTENASDESAADSDQEDEENQLQVDGNDIILPDTPSSTIITKNDKNQTVYTTDGMVAYVNEDGVSGRIYIDVNKLEKNFVYDDWYLTDYVIDSVGDVSLDKIIKFNDGGYVRRIKGNVMESELFRIYVTGAGPEGLFSGSGHLEFTDQTDDTYSLSIWRHSEASHMVKYNSTAHYIKTIEWYSYDNDDVKYPEYPYSPDPYSPSIPDVGYVNEKGQTVYTDDVMTVYVNADGVSGHIDFNTDKLPVKTISKTESRLGKKHYIDVGYYQGTCQEWEVRSVAGVELKDIIKLKDGGFIGAICIDCAEGFEPYLCTYGVCGTGTNWFKSGYAYCNVTDSTGKTSDTFKINESTQWCVGRCAITDVGEVLNNEIKRFEWHA